MAGEATIKPRATSGLGSQVRRTREAVYEYSMHAFLFLLGIPILVPFAWMVSTSLKERGSEFSIPQKWLPDPIAWHNYVDAFTKMNFPLYTRNTVLITVTAIIGTMLTSSLAAYGFARLRFPGRDWLFNFVLATMMLPGIVTLVPTYVLFHMIHWVDTFLPLIVPYWLGGTPFYIFLLRQFILTMPYDLDEAARIDGASTWQIWWTITLPLCKPALATVGIFSFMGRWNDFLEPLIYLNSRENFTLALGLRSFQDFYGADWAYMMAIAVVMTIPVLVVFFSAQRFFMRGIVMTGISGR